MHKLWDTLKEETGLAKELNEHPFLSPFKLAPPFRSEMDNLVMAGQIFDVVGKTLNPNITIGVYLLKGYYAIQVDFADQSFISPTSPFVANALLQHLRMIVCWATEAYEGKAIPLDLWFDTERCMEAQMAAGDKVRDLHLALLKAVRED
ncbi:hypothetical protein S7711_10725 [Stachybotrys chartarum IBT 7711]|uniref:Uncharacterized protein n=1 Tax=Stachybotrys chartarum (strain CBS 109288 / IBT 7711) TaxID=1280523 RepID=A0A084AFV5_STACB|nr:hypothetical protein S7711_10725 [Stachybotrys chartarum IBT 7711]KFA55320.1 hypothetical protein S40293_10873 [Stachybotrys chartarum IBT 40293]